MSNFIGKGVLIISILFLTFGISFAALPKIDFTYYPSGNIHTKVFAENDDNDTPDDPTDDIPVGTIYTYDDTDVHPAARHSYGHIIRHTKPDKSYKTFAEYYDDDHYKLSAEYSDTGALIAAYEYNLAGSIIKKTNSDGSYTTFESHFETGADHARFRKEYNAKGVLIKTLEYSASPYRIFKETFAAPNANCEVFYTYSWNDATQMLTKYSYTNISGAKQHFYAKYQYKYSDLDKFAQPKKREALICRPKK